MRFVGQSEVATYLREYPEKSERLQAWVAEMRRRNWRGQQDLTSAFRDVDTSRSPLTVFRFERPPMQIETLIDFRVNVIMLLTIKHSPSQFMQIQHGNERRDN